VGAGNQALLRFRDKWSADRLVMDKWFALQMAEAQPDGAAETARALAADPAFTWKNPNRFRALVGTFAANHAAFHRADGAGYRFVADWLVRLDPVNPQTAARVATAFETWRRYDAGRQALARAELERIRATPGLSGDMAEMVDRMLSD